MRVYVTDPKALTITSGPYPWDGVAEWQHAGTAISEDDKRLLDYIRPVELKPRRKLLTLRRLSL
jgi:hypothetical protein